MSLQDATLHLSDRHNPTLPDMSTLTIGRMAKLYRLHRSTLYEAVAKGRVSAGHDGKGQRVIALSEMIRVYGEPPGRPTLLPDTMTSPPDSRQTPFPVQADWAELVAELRLLREEVAGFREVLLRVEHKPDTPVPRAVEAKPGQGRSAPLQEVSSFADLLSTWE